MDWEENELTYNNQRQRDNSDSNSKNDEVETVRMLVHFAQNYLDKKDSDSEQRFLETWEAFREGVESINEIDRENEPIRANSTSREAEQKEISNEPLPIVPFRRKLAALPNVGFLATILCLVLIASSFWRSGNTGKALETTITLVPTSSLSPSQQIESSPVLASIASTPQPQSGTNLMLSTEIPTNTQQLIMTLEQIIVTPKNQTVNVRKGPSTDFTAIIGLPLGETAIATGINNAKNWFFVKLQDGNQGWVSADVVTVSGNIDSLLIIDTANLATSNASNPVASGDCRQLVAQSPTDGITNGVQRFYWTTVDGADDYWVSVYNEQNQQVGIANTGGIGTFADIDMSTKVAGPGLYFTWKVQAFKAGKVMCESAFPTRLARATS